MYQVLFRIPVITQWTPDGIPIYGFGVMLFLAFVLCSWIVGRRAESVGIKKEYLHDLMIYLFVAGLFGARVSYLVLHEGISDPLLLLYKLPQIWEGGIILYGAVIGGYLGYLIYYFTTLRKAGITTGRVADVLAPSIALGIAMGRLGCFANGCCYGQVPAYDAPVIAVSFPIAAPATLDLVRQGSQTVAGFALAPTEQQPRDGVRVGLVDPKSPAFAAGLRPGQIIEKVGNTSVTSREELDAALFTNWPRGQRELQLTVRDLPTPISCYPGSLGLHPTQVYETISMFLLFLLLQAYFPFRTRDGQVMALLMMCYAIHRSLNELLRSDARPVGFEHYGSVILFSGGAMLMLWLVLRPAQYRLKWQA